MPCRLTVAPVLMFLHHLFSVAGADDMLSFSHESITSPLGTVGALVSPV